MNGTEIVKLAADLAAGAITANFIKSEYGDGVLTSVLAIGTGSIAGLLANNLLTSFDKETGLVSDVGSLVDDVFSIFD